MFSVHFPIIQALIWVSKEDLSKNKEFILWNKKKMER